MGTVDTLKDFYGDIVDDWKKAWDDLLDRDDDKDLPFGLPSYALAALPGDTLRTLTTLSLLEDDDKKKSKNRGLAALSLLSANNPMGGLGGAGANPLAALGGAGANPLAALGGAVGAPLGAAAGAAQGLAALPQQIQQLTDLISSLLGALQTMQPLLGAVGAATTKAGK